MTQTTITNEMVTEQQVFDYLATHPGFLQQHPELLSHISVPHDVSGGVSLVERQVKILREKNRELQGKLIDMLQAAQSNEALLSQCLRLVLCVVDCESLEQFTNTLSDVLKREFKFDAVSISLIGHWEKVPNVKNHSQPDTLLTALSLDFPDNQPVSGRLDKKLIANLFAGHAISSGSVAIMPLGQNGRFGVLAVASRDQTRFSPDMGSLFLELIAAIASQMLLKFKDF